MVGEQKSVSRLLSSVHPMSIGVREKDKLLRILHRQRAQHHRIEHGENRRVGADAERERDDYYSREAWPLQQTSNSVANVFQQGVHRFSQSHKPSLCSFCFHSSSDSLNRTNTD